MTKIQKGQRVRVMWIGETWWRDYTFDGEDEGGIYVRTKGHTRFIPWSTIAWIQFVDRSRREKVL